MTESEKQPENQLGQPIAHDKALEQENIQAKLEASGKPVEAVATSNKPEGDINNSAKGPGEEQY